ncbi:kinase-like domain-containing protein [Tribonema minus]|uniref:Kinase-like domain-containing protein n=1 Tax=Tribonema minus TaxID=303371 RepID=A0A835ZCT2_9STRA|nr:kinase-like domain-containing protein [Tribonema minus]
MSVNDYVVSGRLGAGVTAQVYECHSPQYGKAALKVIEKSTGRESLHRELMALQALKDHSNIISLFSIIDDQKSDITWLVEEMAERGSLVGVMMSGMECQRMGYEIVCGLAHMHSKGFIHRDVKPANILRAANGTSKLADFGCCVRMEEGGDTARNKHFMGTPAFMAPETFKDGVVTPAVDVWSFASTLHYVVYGTLPFDTRVRGGTKGKNAAVDDAAIEDSIMFYEPYLGTNARPRHMKNMEKRWHSDDVTKFNHFCKMGLHKNPTHRCTLGQWRQHEWLYFYYIPLVAVEMPCCRCVALFSLLDVACKACTPHPAPHITPNKAPASDCPPHTSRDTKQSCKTLPPQTDPS